MLELGEREVAGHDGLATGPVSHKLSTPMRPAASNLNAHPGVKKRPRPFLTEALSCRTGKSLTTSEVSRLHRYGFQIINAGPLTSPPKANIAARAKSKALILAVVIANCESNLQSPLRKR